MVAMLDISEMCFQQDAATSHTTGETIDLLKSKFNEHVKSIDWTLNGLCQKDGDARENKIEREIAKMLVDLCGCSGHMTEIAFYS